MTYTYSNNHKRGAAMTKTINLSFVDAVLLGHIKTYTRKELFMMYAPNFNFELDEQQIIDHGLKVNFLVKKGNHDLYAINPEYK